MEPNNRRTSAPPNDETKYWVAFSRIPGLGAARFQALLDRFGSLASAWAATRNEIKEAGLDDRTVRAIIKERAEIDPDSEMEALEAVGARAITWNHPSYPAYLREADDSPPVLFVRGEIAPADQLAVAVVGTRRPTPYGRQVAEELSYQLAASGIAVVSGLARGIDAIAHRAALQAGGRTLGVMASGLDIIYPPEHARLAREITEHGALITEQPLGTQPRGDFFPRRNRILSGLSLGVLVVEATSRAER